MNVSVLFNQETFWLSQQRMAELFGVTNADISYHLIQIENNGKLHLSDCIQKNFDSFGTMGRAGRDAEFKLA